MASPRRREKLNVLLREEVAAIVDREIEFGKGVLVTVTRADVSPDARYATVYFSLLGSDAGDALAILERSVYDIQQILNKRLRMRPVPRIRFAEDKAEALREGIERSLAALKQKKEL